VLASEAPQHFNAGQSTDLLAFLSAACSGLISPWAAHLAAA